MDRALNKTVVHLQTQGAALGRFRKMTVALSRTPILRWSWKIEKPHADANKYAKAGDDFPVRVHVVVEGGFLGMSTKAFNYVWASKNPVGANWPNPFTSRMLAVNSVEANAGKWIARKRNVHDDLKMAFNEDFT